MSRPRLCASSSSVTLVDSVSTAIATVATQAATIGPSADLTAAAQTLGLQSTGINNNTLVRDALILLADQLPAFTLMGEAF